MAGPVPWPVDDPDHLDERRAAVGIESFAAHAGAGYRHGMGTWSFATCHRVPPGVEPVLQTELADVSGTRLVVETHRLDRWQVSIRRADAQPDADVLVFAECADRREAWQAHEQAVTFTASSLDSTLRRPDDLPTTQGS